MIRRGAGPRRGVRAGPRRGYRLVPQVEVVANFTPELLLGRAAAQGDHSTGGLQRGGGELALHLVLIRPPDDAGALFRGGAVAGWERGRRRRVALVVAAFIVRGKVSWRWRGTFRANRKPARENQRPGAHLGSILSPGTHTSEARTPPLRRPHRPIVPGYAGWARAAPLALSNKKSSARHVKTAEDAPALHNLKQKLWPDIKRPVATKKRHLGDHQ